MTGRVDKSPRQSVSTSSLPKDAPNAGDVYRHFKGGLYRVVLCAWHANDDEWMVVYEPMYDHADAAYFTRPLHEWGQIVERDGASWKRFLKVSS